MSQDSDPAHLFSQQGSLYPALKAALDSLDINFEQELIRFRQAQQASIAVPSRFPQANSQNLPSNLDLTQARVTPSIPAREPLAVSVTTPDLSQSWFPNSQTAPEPVSIQEQLRVAEEPELIGIEADLALISEEARLWSAPTDQALEDYPQDYLESSEALLQSLANDAQPALGSASTLGVSDSSDSILIPVAVGALMALMVAAGALGYLIFYPGRTHPSGPRPAHSLRLTPDSLQLSPNLAVAEFQDLGQVSLGTLLPQDQGALAAVNPAASLPSQPPQPPSNLLSPRQTTVVSPANHQSSVAPQGPYYVIIPESDHQTLQQVQQVVPEAYLERFPTGSYIQLGAFGEASRAKALVQNLQSKGFSAQVYRP